ncbi:MAG: ribose-5-phosphate isomerase RpiA [Haloplanus sp.]
MKTPDGSDAAKRRAGEHAAELVADGDTVGLGTGSTAAHAIRALGQAVDDGLDVRGVTTSYATRDLAREVGIPLVGLDAVDRIDIAIDGADQIDDDLAAIKGGGAAHAREKVVDTAAEQLVVVVDPSKVAAALDRPVAVEVLPDARVAVRRAIHELGGAPTLRTAERKDGPVVTDNGNLVLDADFGTIAEPEALATDLVTIPGVVEHGLFADVADEVHVGSKDGVAVRRADE